MGINKVQYGNTTLIDLTGDTVTPSVLMEGYTAHDKSGAIITGTATGGGSGVISQDSDGYIVIDNEKGDNITLVSKTITENGTYKSEDDNADGYSNVVINVETGYDETLIKNYIQRSSQFTSFELPSGIDSIGAYAFANCQSLTTLNLPTTIQYISSYAFYRTNITLTSLPSNVRSIGIYAFASCPNVTLSSLPSTVTIIDSYAFQYCKNIPSISCDGAITSLNTGAFLGNSSNLMKIASARFPNMVISSMSGVFGSTTAGNACQQLELADIGSTSKINANAFANCYKLQTLVLRKSSVCTLDNVSAFLNTPMRGYNSLTGTVYVPSDLISSYQTATNWSTLYNDGTVTFTAIEGSEYEL